MPEQLERLSDEIVPIMMRVPLERVSTYKELLLPLLDTLEKEREAYGYLLIVVSFLMYRESLYLEAIDALSAYGTEYEDKVPVPIHVGVHTLIGACYRSLGHTEFALEYLQRNIAYSDAVRGDHQYFYALTLYHIAELMGELHEYEEMLDKHMLSLKFYEYTKNDDFYFRSTNGVGRAYCGMKNYDMALHFLLSVEEDSKQDANIPFRARNLHDIGTTYATLEAYDDALLYFGKALALRQEHGLRNASISTRMQIGRILITRARFNEAIEVLKKALDEAEAFDVKKKQYEICKLLSEAYELQGEWDVALSYFKLFHAVKEGVDNVNYTKAESQRVREVNTLLEEQTRLIEAQKLKIEESHRSIEALNENLEDVVQERTTQLRDRNEQLKHYAFMNAHEVRGPLSTILGLLQIASEFKTAEEKAELIEMIEASALKLDGTIRKMHEDLKQFNTLFVEE